MSALQLKTESGLSAAELQQAKDLQTQFPELTKLATDIAQLEYERMGKYVKLCRLIRSTRLKVAAGAERTLNRREVTLFLGSLGYPKQRVTEVNRVVEVPDAKWAEFEKGWQANTLGFREALTDARGGKTPVVPQVPGEDGGEPAEDGGKPPEKPVTPSKVDNVFPDKAMENMRVYLAKNAKYFPISAEPYVMTYDMGKGQKFEIRLFSDKV